MCKRLAIFLVCALVLSLFPSSLAVLAQEPAMPQAEAALLLVSPNIVISQVYGGGGNTGAQYQNDFIELFNLGTTAVNVTGWSVQYAATTGVNWQKTDLSGTIPSGGYYLVREAAGNSCSGSPCGSALPTPDATGSIAMAAGAGKVALVNNNTLITAGTSCPSGATIVDFVGYGTATNCYEGTGPAPQLSNTTADFRALSGCQDTDVNSADFSAAAPVPRNSASAVHYCGGPTNPSGVGASNPSAVYPGGTSLLTVAVTPGANPPSTGLAVTCTLTATGGSAAQTFYDDGTNGDVTTGDNTFSFSATVALGTTPGSKSLPCTITDAESRSGSATVPLYIRGPLIPIHDIQGAGHLSPYSGQAVSTTGIVTAKRSYGFWMQDPNPDSDDATSEGIFVYTSSAPTVSAGDSLLVSANVAEFRPGGGGGLNNLTTTELDSPIITVNSSGNPLPSATVIGTGGRLPPTEVIEDDATGDVETSGVVDPDSDGIDFYESLEAMWVQVNDAVAVGATDDYTSNREIPVVGDNGANASVRTPRGGLVVRSTDFNPERIILNDWIAGGPLLPAVDVGDSFPGAVLGVIDYSFANFKLQVAQLPALVAGGLARETTVAAGADELAVATFNVENLSPNDPQSKFDTLAALIKNNLQSPDVIAVEEIQDNNGTTDNGVVDASTTWGTLIARIQAAGGPTYGYRQIDPVDNQDGGAPGGNIRQGFMFRTDRGLSFVDRPGAGSSTANAVVGSGAGTQLQYSPGRIDPTNVAFTNSRKPLAGEFLFNGKKLFVIANHFNSKGGDQPLFGHLQPPTFSSEAQRLLQAQVVHDFVDDIVTAEPYANVVVLGDLNDYHFSNPLLTLMGTPAILNNLMETLPEGERYSYVYEGNSEVLDQILISNGLFTYRPFQYDVVHVNSEFDDQVSDHEPQVVRILLRDGDLTVSKAAEPDLVRRGDVLTYTVTYSNTTTDPCTEVWMTDTLPAGVTFGGVVSSPLGWTGPNAVGQDLGWYIPILGSGASGAFVFSATADLGVAVSADWVLTNTTEITATVDVTPTNNAATAASVLQGLALTKRHNPDPVTATWNFWYYIDVTNTASSAATNLVIEDVLPVEVPAYSVVPSAGGVFDGVNKVTWSIPSLGPNSSMQVWIRARTFSTAAGKCMVNSAVADSEQAAPTVGMKEIACVVAPPAAPQPTPTPTPGPGAPVIIQQGTFGHAEDTHIYRYAPDKNYFLAPQLKAGGKQNYAALLRFDLSPIPAGATIDSAMLQVYAEGWGGMDLPIGAYAVLRNVQLVQTTWNLAQTGLPWEVAGANGATDRRLYPESSILTHGPKQWYSFDLTVLVQEWVNGALSNNSVLLRAENSYPAEFYFTSAEGGTVGWRPKLVVRYH